MNAQEFYEKHTANLALDFKNYWQDNAADLPDEFPTEMDENEWWEQFTAWFLNEHEG